ncbi:hypothetical protein IJE86_05860 [bacterium]|nr:hypothetical protein [bacterium]
MTTYHVPYTFIPGTKAKANEVNENFAAVLNYIADTKQSSSDINLSNITDEAKRVIYDNSVPTHLVGEIIASPIPLTDGGLHLLDGEILSSDGLYPQFIEYIASFKDNYPELFCSESEWQEIASNSGYCGKFVYNNTEKTLRLPKISDLEQITNSESGESNNSTIEVLYYIVVANGIKNEADITIDNIATDLNNKLNTDLSNLNACLSAKTEIADWIAPDIENSITITLPYTTPSAGWLYITLDGTLNGYNGVSISVNSKAFSLIATANAQTGYASTVTFVPQNANLTHLLGSGKYTRYFIPMKGAK